MPALAFVTPIQGASVTTVWKPPLGVTPGVAGDATAPFALGTTGSITPPTTGTPNNRILARFCRVGAAGIAIGGTTAIGTDGVTSGAGVFTNDTGVALVTGDYVWLTAGLTVALAADEAAVEEDEPPSALAADEAAADDYGKKRAKAHA